MNGPNETRKTFVATLARKNGGFYGTLRAFEPAFEHRWGYLSELVRNAPDAEARSIAFRVAEASRSRTLSAQR